MNMAEPANSIDLGPPARRLAGLVARIPDEDLTLPTPCPAYALGDLTEHVGGLAIAFAAAASRRRPARCGLAGAHPPRPQGPGPGLAGARRLVGDDQDRRHGHPGGVG